MKSVTLIITTSLFSLCSCSQNIPANKVPSVVLNSLQTKFVNANKIEWEKKSSMYEAEFKMDSMEYAVYIDPTGKLLMYKLDIKEDELPVAVSAAIQAEYAGFKIDEAERIEKDGIFYYQVELEKKGKKDLELVFSTNGKLATQINYLK